VALFLFSSAPTLVHANESSRARARYESVRELDAQAFERRLEAIDRETARRAPEDKNGMTTQTVRRNTLGTHFLRTRYLPIMSVD
jgi:hypothetical protein